MKFLCSECQEAMKLDKTGGLEDDGTFSVRFACPSCDWGFVMWTNPQETQMVRSLGVKIGGSHVPPAPMETLRAHLGTTEGTPSGKCPFSAMLPED
ncbi:MAG: hypothetical protein KDC35_03470 [Acidobacteria bacterium]|nr:hypothetical protein [Acidobacteriota bacterium]